MKATLVVPKKTPNPAGFVLGDKVAVQHLRKGKVIYSDGEK